MPGYDAKFVGELQKRHECTICKKAMKLPRQTECGHLFCKDCLEPLFTSINPLCPIDKERISREETFPDNACKREILHLPVYCSNNNYGCQWIGELNKLESHVDECMYRQIRCTQCGRYVPCGNYQVHLASECPMRPAVCQHCGNRVPNDQLEAHIKKVCPASLHHCPNQCDTNKQFRLAELNEHLSVKGGDCPLHVIPCPFNKLGCSYEAKRQDMGTHLDERKVYHTQLMVDEMVECIDKTNTLSQDFKRLHQKLSDVETRTTTTERKQLVLDSKYGLQEDQRQRMSDKFNSQISSLEFALEDLRKGPLNSSYSMSSYRNNPLTSVQGAAAYSSALSQRVDHLYSKVNEVDHTVSRCLNYSLDFDVRLQLTERATYDGSLLWKIDNYSQRRKEAIDGTTLSLYSTPFYTSKQGYKMCIRVYLNGDGMGKEKYLSFFFVLMRGPNDSLLPWPFQQKVTLLLINQNGGKNIVDQFRPDNYSSSFQQPIKREMNIASGCPAFCLLSQLQKGFIKDDCLYLGVIVDTTGIPVPVSL